MQNYFKNKIKNESSTKPIYENAAWPTHEDLNWLLKI